MLQSKFKHITEKKSHDGWTVRAVRGSFCKNWIKLGVKIAVSAVITELLLLKIGILLIGKTAI
jgi:hypothetical protein